MSGRRRLDWPAQRQKPCTAITAGHNPFTPMARVMMVTVYSAEALTSRARYQIHEPKYGREVASGQDGLVEVAVQVAGQIVVDGQLHAEGAAVACHQHPGAVVAAARAQAGVTDTLSHHARSTHARSSGSAVGS